MMGSADFTSTKLSAEKLSLVLYLIFLQAGMEIFHMKMPWNVCQRQRGLAQSPPDPLSGSMASVVGFGFPCGFVPSKAPDGNEVFQF